MASMRRFAAILSDLQNEGRTRQAPARVVAPGETEPSALREIPERHPRS